MNTKIQVVLIGLFLVSASQAFAQATDYSRGYNDGFNAGLARCGGNGGGQPPASSLGARCIPIDTGYGNRYELRLNPHNSTNYIVVANSDGQGSDANRRYCHGAIDDLRATRFRYMCVPVRVGNYGNQFDLVKIDNTGTQLYTNVIQSFNGQGTERNLNNCRAELRYQP